MRYLTVDSSENARSSYEKTHWLRSVRIEYTSIECFISAGHLFLCEVAKYFLPGGITQLLNFPMVDDELYSICQIMRIEG